MDAQAVNRAHDELLAWGLIEHGTPPRLTKRVQAAIARAAAAMAQREAAGEVVAGHPLANIAAGALEALVPGKWTNAHRDVVAAIELASLPDGVATLLADGRRRGAGKTQGKNG